MILFLYRCLIALARPFLPIYLRARAQSGKEDAARLSERYGLSSAPPFPDHPLWVHAASVGEALAALTLIRLVRDVAPDVPILLTTGTRSSAQMVASRLPPRTIHQYAPLDHPDWCTRFLDTWRPFAALRLESEIWPHMMLALKARKIPVALINGHLSDKSFSRWCLVPRTARQIMGIFTAILAEGQPSTRYFNELGARQVHTIQNIKFLSDPLPYDPQKLADIKSVLGHRACWLYASTHPDEELIAAQIHEDLRARFPNALTIIALRHPSRADEVAQKLFTVPGDVTFRSNADLPPNDTDIYVVDTMGEMGLFFALCPVAMMGKSFTAKGGGHNPIEAAQMGCFPLSGPKVQNLQTIFDVMTENGAAEYVADPAALTNRLIHYLTDREETRAKGAAAQAFVTRMNQHMQDDLHQFLDTFIKGARV